MTVASTLRIGVALIFLGIIGGAVGAHFEHLPQIHLLMFAAVVGGYMALNIGANDVANNVGPAVGSLAMTLGSAILVAAVFEAGGALLAGGEVVKTVKKGIIDPELLAESNVYIWVMLAALMGAAIWLNIATALGAPVSTTHSIVGGVMGGAIAAQGWGAVNWSSMASIAASWVISPVTGGLIAAGLLLIVMRTVLFRHDVLAAAQRVAPVMIALMAWAFVTYVALKGVKHLVAIPLSGALGIGFVAAVGSYFFVAAWVRQRIPHLEASRAGVNSLFTIPLIFAAALLSFAHGANDVANAVGPLAGIYDALDSGHIAGKVAIPLWVMMIGALGIALGLALFGPRLIRTVGSEITELDRIRAFCIALSAAVTVIIASQLGLPVSSTHVALGAVFGVGFLREYLDSRLARAMDDILDEHRGQVDYARLQAFFDEFKGASREDKDEIFRNLKKFKKEGVLTKEERRRLRSIYKRRLVKRSMLMKIVSAWIITVPVSAGLAALFYFMLRGMLLP